MKLSKTQLAILHRLQQDKTKLVYASTRGIFHKWRYQDSMKSVNFQSVDRLLEGGYLHFWKSSGNTMFASITPAGRAALADGRKETRE